VLLLVFATRLGGGLFGTGGDAS